MLKRFKEALWPDQRINVIQGREIAGRFMLETIFDLLRSWNDLNLKNFLIQLKQFHQVYGNPYVYEEKHEKWFSLNYDEKDVSIYYLTYYLLLCTFKYEMSSKLITVLTE